MIDFRISGVSPEPFAALYGLSDDELAERCAKRYIVDEKPGFPDRIEMRDLEPGESALLVNYVHQPAATPYRASHAIFVREGATKAYDAVNEVPEMLRVRTLSLRAFDAAGMMVDAALSDGHALEETIARFFARNDVSVIQAHSAQRGCFVASIERAR